MNSSHTISSLISRRSILLFPRYGRYLATIADKKSFLSNSELPNHTLHSEYKGKIQSSRVGREADEFTGIRPSASQKYFLVLTRVFRNTSEIPEYVPNPTMKKMHDRMRAIIILTAFSLFYAISYGSELRTRRQMDMDKAAGKVVQTYADIK